MVQPEPHLEMSSRAAADTIRLAKIQEGPDTRTPYLVFETSKFPEG